MKYKCSCCEMWQEIGKDKVYFNTRAGITLCIDCYPIRALDEFLFGKYYKGATPYYTPVKP